jgi:hypothetical protein
MAALYGTIWLAMVLFAAGEGGRSLTPRGHTPPGWAWWAFTAGLALAGIHTLLAFHIVHDWSHANAVTSTAIQTHSTYGLAFGGGVYVNYLFLGVWLADAWWWRAKPSAYVRPAALVWTLRVFYMVIIFNAAVVFAAGFRRIAGVIVVSWLGRVWSGPLISPAPSSRHPQSPADRMVSR